MTGRGVRFAPRFRVEVGDGEAVVLLSERGAGLLRGDAYVRLAPLLVEGDRDDRALVDALAGVVAAAEVFYALGRMRARGFVVDGDVPADRAGWWGEVGVDPHVAERRLASALVAVVAVGDGIDTTPI